MAGPQVEVLDHRGGPHARRITGAEIAVDVVLAQARIGQRAFGHLAMQLGHGMMRCPAQRVLVSTHDAGAVMNAHTESFEEGFASALVWPGLARCRSSASRPPARTMSSKKSGTGSVASGVPSVSARV